MNPSSSFSPSGYPGTTATAIVGQRARLFGHMPTLDEPDTRPMPDADVLNGFATALIDAFSFSFSDTGLESELPDLMWSAVDLFHRKADRIQRMLDTNENRQRESQSQQDGSEVRDVELQRLTAQGQRMMEHQATFEALRDYAAEKFEAYTGDIWRPRSGSVVNRKHLTAALVDSRDYLAAKHKAQTEVHLPKGPKVAFAGGLDFNNIDLIWATLDKVLAKHPDMVLVHGGTTTGAEKIAACWADNRKVVQIAFKPEWRRDGKSAPFKRNDRMLEQVPIGLVVFPGSGITDNLADKARAQGVPLIDFRIRAA